MRFFFSFNHVFFFLPSVEVCLSSCHLQVARLPFRDQMSLLIVLPMSGQVNVTDIAAKLNTSDLYARFPKERSMQVRLPKFKLEYGQELEEALTSIGKKQLCMDQCHQIMLTKPEELS